MARRAKSNTEQQSSGGAAQQKKIRRLRHERKAEAQTKRFDEQNSAERAPAEDADVLSHRSVSATSNLTTPLRNSVSTLINGKNCMNVRRESSRLKQPTPLRKSATLKATLSRIDSQSKAGSSVAADDLVV